MTRKSSTIAIDRDRFPVDVWRLVETGLGDDDGGRNGTLFVTGNGYLGLRADWAPDPDSTGTYVNGFHETFPIEYPEKRSPWPAPVSRCSTPLRARRSN